MSTPYHRDDYSSQDEYDMEAFRLGYNDGAQREEILDAFNDGNYSAAEDLIQERFDQGDSQSLGDIYADLWDALDQYEPEEREDIINELFGYPVS